MTAPRLRIAMNIHIIQSKNRHYDTVNWRGLRQSRPGEACIDFIKIYKGPNDYRLQSFVWQNDPICRNTAHASKLKGQKLKTRDLLADITLNKRFAVSTKKRVFFSPLTV